jgi:hypothetical protein
MLADALGAWNATTLRPRTARVASLGKAPALVTVPVGEHRSAKGNETLHAEGLSDCTAVVFMTNRERRSGIYRNRTMLHINGSNLNAESTGANHQYASAGDVLLGLLDSRKGNDHRLVIGFGTNSSSASMQRIFKEQQASGRSPITECLTACGANVEERIDTLSLTVAADGKVLA